MGDKTSLGDRMKLYEKASESFLTPRMPKVLRVDGKAFHTFTRGFQKPWDESLMEAMTFAAIGLVSNIQGAKLAYIQSDEISVLINDFSSLTSSCWFDGKIQKMDSVGASIATAYFNEKIRGKTTKLAFFDARVFCVPTEDIDNYFIWRQRDAERNSVQGLAQSHFSHNELQNKKTSELVSLLEDERSIIWGNLSSKYKRGWCVRKSLDPHTTRSSWSPDWNIPRFSEDRNYILQHLEKESG